MATATVNQQRSAKLQPEMQLEQGWKRVNAPELFSFEKAGMEVAGVLVDVAVVEIAKDNQTPKRVPQYMLQFNERLIKILGTADLVQKLTTTRKFVGSQVRIKYLGEDQTITKNGNAMRVFDVVVKPAATPITNVHGVAVTDEDIPF